MARYILTIVLVIVLSGCGKKAYQEPATLTIANQFDLLYHKDSSGIPITFTDSYDVDNRIGYCESNPFASITIKKSWFDKAEPLQQRALIFHELGHCVLGRAHKDDKYSDGCPSSLMSTILIGSSCYEKHQKELEDELINGK